MSSIPLSLVPLRTSTMGDLWHHVGGTPVQVVIIVVAAVAVRWLAHRAISRAVEAMIADGNTPENRAALVARPGRRYGRAGPHGRRPA